MSDGSTAVFLTRLEISARINPFQKKLETDWQIIGLQSRFNPLRQTEPYETLDVTLKFYSPTLALLCFYTSLNACSVRSTLPRMLQRSFSGAC